MPLYEYECKQCRQRLEKIQSFSAAPEKVCPKCGGELERVISAPAIQFKGAGWYVNDYAKSGAKKAPANGADGKTESKSEGASENKSESKSDGANAAKSSGDSTSNSSTASNSGSSASESSATSTTKSPSTNSTS